MDIEGPGKVVTEKGNEKRGESMRDVRTALDKELETIRRSKLKLDNSIAKIKNKLKATNSTLNNEE